MSSTIFTYGIIKEPICHKKTMRHTGSGHSGEYNEYIFECTQCKRIEKIEIIGIPYGCDVCRKKQAEFQILLYKSKYMLKSKCFCEECAEKDKIVDLFKREGEPD